MDTDVEGCECWFVGWRMYNGMNNTKLMLVIVTFGGGKCYHHSLDNQLLAV